MKLKIYGDSVLKGVIYSEELKKYRLFGYKYDSLAENGIEVENNCKMGATIGKGSEIIKATLDDCEKDTCVVMEYGGNDCNFDWAAVAADPDSAHLPATPRDEFCEKYIKAVEYAQKRGAEVAVCTLVPIESKRFINWVSRGLSYENILKFMHGDVNVIGRWQEGYSKLAERVAKATGCRLLDLRTPFSRPGEIESLICVDGIHPNARGHEMLSSVFQSRVLGLTT